MIRKIYKYYIGIDTGTNTGFAVWNKSERRLVLAESLMIHQAMKKVEGLQHVPGGIFVRVEDARLRKWIPKERSREVLQGVGSVKRDAQIWEDFLQDNGIPFEMVAPKNNKTKTTAHYFKKLTGWPSVTNEHSRDAAMLIFGI